MVEPPCFSFIVVEVAVRALNVDSARTNGCWGVLSAN
jgi:hypothetical protein